MAGNTINDAREKISLRISKTDLMNIKSRALQEGISCQILINSIYLIEMIFCMFHQCH